MKSINMKVQTIKVSNVTQKTVSIIGQKGAGKSTLIRMIGESFDGNVPCIILDPVGGQAVKSNTFFQVKVTSSNMSGSLQKWLKETWEKKGTVLVDTSRLTTPEYVEWGDQFFNQVWLKDGIIIVDETHFLVPQMRGKFSLQFQKFAKICRNDNVGLIISSQRPQSVSKEILALTDVYVIGRVVYTSDREITMSLIEPFLSKEEYVNYEKEIQEYAFMQFLVVDYQSKASHDFEKGGNK